MPNVGAGAHAELTAMRRLHALSTQLVAGTETEPLLGAVLDAAIDLLHADSGFIQTHDCRAGVLRVVAHRGLTEEVVARVRTVGPGLGACGAAMVAGCRVVVEDASVDPLFAGLRDIAARAPFRGVQATPLLSRSGELLGMLATQSREPRRPDERELQLLDLLARQAADFLERARMIDDLRASDRAKDELIAALAHELRNPLAPMRTALDLVKGKPDDRARTVRAHEILDQQLTHLVRLVDDLLDVARITRNALELQPEPLDLVDVVKGSVESGRRTIEAANQTLEIALPDDAIVVSGDAVRLAQVVVTLLDDAAKRAGEGARVRLAVRSDASSARLSVTDDGPGLPTERLRRVLEPFASSPCAKSPLGVGLTLVQKIAELHGGDVAFAPGEAGRGTEIVVRLPLHVEGAPEQRRRRALVVDDNEDGATLLAELLTDHGVEVSTVFDGTSALAAVHAFAPDVVFLDISLPDIDGNDVARRIRASTLPMQPLLVAVTGWARPKDRARAEESGFDRHIVKPVDIASVRRVLAI